MPRPECPSENKSEIDQSAFWDSNGVNWSHHRIGWAVAGSCALLVCLFIMLLSTTFILRGAVARSYTNPREQRQILRILYMPPVYAIISFFSYRFFRHYTYYSFIEVAYEAVTLSAFLLLIIEYVASTASGNKAENAIARKDKSPLPLPFCFWRYRPTKAYFMYTVKWSVLQYVIIRPLVSIAGIVCEKLKVLCESAGWSVYYASVYLEAIDFVSISIALYGLLVFYGLMAEELKGRRPLAKFMCIKLIVMFTFYQSFVFHALEGKVIKETRFWTATNISNGLNALAICIEMVFFSALMMWAYTPYEYKLKPGAPATGIWRPLWDSINFSDFGREIWGSLRFFLDSARGKSHQVDARAKMDFGEAFGVTSGSNRPHRAASSSDFAARNPAARQSYDEHIHLAPYESSYPPQDPYNVKYAQSQSQLSHSQLERGDGHGGSRR